MSGPLRSESDRALYLALCRVEKEPGRVAWAICDYLERVRAERWMLDHAKEIAQRADNVINFAPPGAPPAVGG